MKYGLHVPHFGALATPKFMATTARMPSTAGTTKSSTRARVESAGAARGGMRAQTSTIAIGYSTTERNATGAIRALNTPPSAPPTASHR